MTEGRNYYAVDTVFPLVAVFTAKSLSSVKKCYLTGVNVLYSETAYRVLLAQRGAEWGEGELVRFQPETGNFKAVVEKTFSSQCSFGLLKLRFHSLDHLVKVLEKFGGFSFMEAGTFERFRVLMKKY